MYKFSCLLLELTVAIFESQNVLHFITSVRCHRYPLCHLCLQGLWCLAAAEATKVVGVGVVVGVAASVSWMASAMLLPGLPESWVPQLCVWGMGRV